MGKSVSSKFKSVAKKVSKGVDKASKAAVPLAYAAKYNKEIAAVAKFAKENMPKGGGGKGNTLETLAKGAKGAAKAAKFVAKNADKIPLAEIGKAGKELLKDPNVQKFILEKAGGYAVKKGEKALDKKFGDKKGYRIAKGGVKLLYNVGTGNVGGAVKQATGIYGEADPNKKRVAKVKAYASNISNLANSAMSGDYQGAMQAGMNTYAMADPNKKRVAKVQKYSNKVQNVANAAGQVYGSLKEGNIAGAASGAMTAYSELDPNKKRVAKVQKYSDKAMNVANAAGQVYGSLAEGNLAGAASGAMTAYSELDPNKKRVGKVGNFVSGTQDIYNAGADIYGSGSSAYNIADRSKIGDVQAPIKNKKVNSALAAGANIGQHKVNIITAHQNEDYGAMATHAKMLHKEAKKANKLQSQYETSKANGVMPMGEPVKYMSQGPIGVSSRNPM